MTIRCSSAATASGPCGRTATIHAQLSLVGDPIIIFRPWMSVTMLEDDLDDWDDLTEEERQAIRGLVRDLGGEPTDDPDEYE